jgi:hypothetical protein
VNFAVAACPPTSVALTVVPDVPLGTLNVQLNVPVALVVKDPLVQLVIVFESKTSDFSFVNTENPVPDTVTVEPTLPLVGLTVIFGVVTVNFAVAVAPPLLVALTVVPDVPVGTLNVQLNAPAEFAVNEPLVQLVIVLESKTSDVSFVDAANPVPATVTVEPTGPCVGLTVIARGVTVNVIVTPNGAPFTVTFPDEGLEVYPLTDPTE